MTALFHIDAERVTEAHFEELRENEVGEGIQLDYKSTTWDDPKEFSKDVSSFANTAGGDILVGITENAGLPTEISGLELDLDKEKQRLENILRDKLEPRIRGVRIVIVPLTTGRQVLVVRVPKSWNGPHAVVHNRARLIYARNSAGVHEASTDEMRAMFNAGAELFERASRFQQHRMDMVHEGGGPFLNFRGDGGRLVLHVVPFSALSSGTSVDLRRLADPGELVPIYSYGCNYGYNVDGYWTTSDSEPRGGYLQVFRNGIIETAAGDIRTQLPVGRVLLTYPIEDQIAVKVANCLQALRRADVSLPAYIMVGGVRMSDTFVIFNPAGRAVDGLRPLPPRFCLPPVVFDDFATIDEYRLWLKPMFDAIWNAAGHSRSQSYDADGKWIRKT